MKENHRQGIFRLLQDFDRYQPPKMKAKHQLAKKVSAPATAVPARQATVENNHFDQGEEVSFSHSQSTPSHQMTDTEHYDAVAFDDEQLQRELEYRGYEVESFAQTSDLKEEEEQPLFAIESSMPTANKPQPDLVAIEKKTVVPDDNLPVDVHDDDSFEADLKAILSGKKTFSPASKNETVYPQSTTADEPQKDEHAIFEKIAQSMKLANAYELGTLELENRFDRFDTEEDEKKK